MISFACLGHWYVQILFGAPSAGIMLVMGRDSLRRKKRRRARPPRRRRRRRRRRFRRRAAERPAAFGLARKLRATAPSRPPPER
jgi:hypothetical protein